MHACRKTRTFEPFFSSDLGKSRDAPGTKSGPAMAGPTGPAPAGLAWEQFCSAHPEVTKRTLDCVSIPKMQLNKLKSD